MQPRGRGQPLKLISGLAELPAIENDELSTPEGGEPLKPSSGAVVSPLVAADAPKPFKLGSAARFICARADKPRQYVYYIHCEGGLTEQLAKV